MTATIKTNYTEAQLRHILDAGESEVEKIIRLNPHLNRKEMERALQINCSLSASTISYNLSHNIGTLWAFQGVVDRKALAEALKRIDNLARLFPLLPWAAQKKKGLDRIVRGRR